MNSTPKKIMKLEPPKDYKKPLYACALAATLAVTSMAITGCDDTFEFPDIAPSFQGFVSDLSKLD